MFHLWPSTTPPRVPEPTDCITENVITVLPYKVWRELIIKLDPLRQLGGDYKDLLSALTSVMFFLEFYAIHVEKTLFEEKETDPWSVEFRTVR